MYFHRFILREFYRLCAITEQCECSKLTPPFSFADILDSLALALLSLLLYILLARCFRARTNVASFGGCVSYQGLHVAVKSMSVVSSELGVGTLERGVTRSLGLLDTVQESAIVDNVGEFDIITRSCAPCATGCAGSCSLTLRQCQ